jgi:hypothetical protein
MTAAGDAVGPDVIVSSGVEYGPSDTALQECMPFCEVSTTYRAHCGHVFCDIPCHDAFEMAAGRLAEPKCLCTVPFESPLCGHTAHSPAGR